VKEGPEVSVVNKVFLKFFIYKEEIWSSWSLEPKKTKGRRTGADTRAMFIILSLKRSQGELECPPNHALQSFGQGCEHLSRRRNGAVWVFLGDQEQVYTGHDTSFTRIISSATVMVMSGGCIRRRTQQILRNRSTSDKSVSFWNRYTTSVNKVNRYNAVTCWCKFHV